MNENYEKLLNKLLILKKYHSASALKLELETEIISTSEIDLAKRLVSDSGLEFTLKTSGCSAVSDIYLAKALEAQNLLAPMIESRYSLEKFYLNTKDILEDEKIKLMFNLETIWAYKNIDEILDSKFIENFESLVFGRNDFCCSLDKPREYADSDEIFLIVERILKELEQRELNFILGGNITNSSIGFMKKLKSKNFKGFETRKITFDKEVLNGKPLEALNLALEFELLWLSSKSFENILDEKRKEILSERISKCS